MVTVTEVKTSNVHACINQGAQGLLAPARGTQGADNLRLPLGYVHLGENITLAADDGKAFIRYVKGTAA